MEGTAHGGACRRILIGQKETVIWENDIYDLDYVLSALGIEDSKGQSAKSLPSAPIGKRRFFSGKRLIKYLDALFEDEAKS